MLKSLARCALVAATVTVGFAGLGAAPAAADNLRIVIGDGARLEPVQYRGDWRDDRRRDDSCRPRLALRKAYDLGADRPRIVRENRRVVVVDGFRRGRPITVRFANEGGCPVVGVRR